MTAQPEEARRLAAIMFTDMVGFSALAERSEAAALALLAEQQALFDQVVPEHAGSVVKTTGDGYLVEFASASSAVGCALAIQSALAERNAQQPEERRLLIRIGIHLGDVVHLDGDVIGDGVNIAARLEPLAEPGGTCISRAIHEQVHHRLEAEYTRVGEVALKNLTRPVEVYQVAAAPPQDRPAQAEPERKAVAVLAFANMSADEENEFLSDGIAEDLITALSHLRGLRVASRTSSFAFKGRNEDIRRIGQALGVTHVVEGSVRKAGQRLRITAQLIDVADGYHVWSERFDREMRDVFDIQDDITRAIARALEVELAGPGDVAPMAGQTSDPEAYAFYLKGRACWNRRGMGVRKALHYYELALLEDPSYALAAGGLAEVQIPLLFYGLISPEECATRCRRAGQRALSLVPHLAPAESALACVRCFCDWDLAGSERLLRDVLRREPGYIPARYWLAGNLLTQGRDDEAIAEDRRATQMEPDSEVPHLHLGMHLNICQRYDEAVAPLLKARELGADAAAVQYLLGTGHLLSGDLDTAVRELTQVVEMTARQPYFLSRYGQALAMSGRRAEAEAILNELVTRADTELVPHSYRVGVHLGLGNHDAALEVLYRSVAEREFDAVALYAHAGYFGIPDMPAYRALVDTVRQAVQAAEEQGRSER